MTDREECLISGRKLADAILAQTRLCEMYFTNREALARLDGLQNQFFQWMQSAEKLGVDVSAEFGDRLAHLKPYRKPLSLYEKIPRTWDELFAIEKFFEYQAKRRPKPPSDWEV